MNKLRLSFIILLLLAVGGALFGDGFIIIEPEPIVMPVPELPNPFPLEVKYHKVDVTINELSALTEIDQLFYNPTNRRVEGTYLFPIPKNAAIKRFTMYIDGKRTEAELLDASKARKIYEDIVRSMQDPALLEYEGRSLFKVRIFPIEPRSEKRVTISYNEILESDNGTTEYTYPLNTEKFSAKELRETTINVRLNSSEPLKGIYCTSHNAEIVRKGEKSALISYEEQNSRPDRDFKLYFHRDSSKFGASILSYREPGKDGFFFLNISPGYEIEANEISSKDITFVLDTSGSMAGEKLEQAKRALLFCINNLNPGDRFEVIRFSTEAEQLFGGLKGYDSSTKVEARKFIEDFRPIGGTNIEEALTMALSNSKGGTNPHLIVFITDGRPTIGEMDEAKLLAKVDKKNSHKTRIFTFGIGTELNIHLLDKLTENSRAYRSYISPEEDIEVKISNFYLKVQSPVLSNIRLTFPKGIRTERIHPHNLPDLFRGSSLNILGRYKGSGEGIVILEGTVNGKPQSYKFKLDFPTEERDNEAVPRLWAARRVGYLLDLIRLNGESRELVEEVTELARSYGIITPYTSYLIVEDETVRTGRGELDAENQTLNNILTDRSPLLEESKKDYYRMKEKSGNKSVEASEELQALNEVDNISQTSQGDNRLYYSDEGGKVKNLSQQHKNIRGRAFYQTGDYWIDSEIQNSKAKRVIKIRFAGKEYFKLLKDKPEAVNYLYLGRNIRFLMDGVIYEIYE